MSNEEQHQPLQLHDVSRCPSDVEMIESLNKKVEEKQRKLNDLENKFRECREEYRQLISFQIAQLRAVQMLYDVMKNGNTHYQKALFAEIAKESLGREIGSLIERYQNTKWKFRLGDEPAELPF